LTFQQSMGGAFPGAGNLCIAGDGSVDGWAFRNTNPGDLANGTIFGLVKVAALGQAGVVCSIAPIFHQGDSWGVGYGVGPANTFEVITQGGVQIATADAPFTVNQWYSVAGVLSGSSTQTIYINGVLQTDTGSFNPGIANAELWMYGDSANSNFCGASSLSHVAIITSALTGPQIAALHTVALTAPPATALNRPSPFPPVIGGWGA
jgi:hypothetical protein